MFNTEQNIAPETENGKSLDVLSLAGQFAEFYGMFMNLLQELAAKKGLKIPNDFPEPNSIAAVSADTAEGCQMIRDTLNKVLAFVEENGLRRHSTPEEMVEFIKWHTEQKTPVGETLLKLAKIKTAITVGVGTRLQIAALNNLQDNRDEVLEPLYLKKEVIEAAGKAIKDAGFPVDGEKLVKNYLRMAEKEPKKAYDLLIHNPATFAPIQTNDVKTGNVRVNPSEGPKINKQLGKFLKGLKV